MKKLISLLLVLMMFLSLLSLTALATEEEFIETTEEMSEEPAEEATEESTEEASNEPIEESTEETFASLDGASATATSGSCGDALTWTLKAGELTISGTGEMTDYSSSNPPWSSSGARVKKVVINAGVTSIGDRAFIECTALGSITLPDGMTRIGVNAFYECKALESVDIPDSVTSLGSGAFYCCTSLTSVTIPGGVTSLEASLFNGCSALESITIPDGVKSIGFFAFSGCTELKSITLPASVASIGARAFNGCSALTTVHYKGSEQGKAAISIGSGNTPLGEAVWECATQAVSASISAAKIVIGKKSDGSIAVTVKLNGTTLTEGTDYSVETTEKDGNISVTVTGRNDYFGIATASLDYIPGDVNNDGKTNIMDVLTLLKYVAGISGSVVY